LKYNIFYRRWTQSDDNGSYNF